MRRSLVVLFASVSALALPCGWDRDTLRNEGDRFPDMVQVITGRFERNPPLYYQMRIDRVQKELAKSPGRLDLYDDIGWAYDKIANDDQALLWMGRKKAAMDALGKKVHPIKSGEKLDEFSEAVYRYYANIGTIRIHRWLRRGGKPEEMADAKKARDEIAEAVRINPDAHFGREAVQQHVLEWLIDVPGGTAKDLGKAGHEISTLAEYLQFSDSEREDPMKTAKGIAGMIVLGNAWESADMFAALATALSGWSGKSAPKLGYLAECRMKELVANGHAMRVSAGDWSFTERVQETDKPAIQAEFKHLREEAEKWAKERDEYMLVRLRQGRHPDTDPRFWDDYHPAPAPRLSEGGLISVKRETLLALGSAVLLAVLGIVVLLIRDRLRARRAH